MKLKQLSLILAALTLGATAQAGTQIPYYEITPSTTLLPYAGGFSQYTPLWRSVSQLSDGIIDMNNEAPINGFVGPVGGVGTISLELARKYDLDSFLLWNDTNVGNEGVRNFYLDFYDELGNKIATSPNYTATSKQAANVFTFPSLVKGVKRVDMVITSISYEIEIRELAFTGTQSSVATVADDLANTPIPLDNNVPPNVLVILDNSQSMDALMEGKLVAGDFRDEAGNTTRSNIGRKAVRDAMVSYQKQFNWGLMSFNLATTPTLNHTYVYAMGTNASMNFIPTADCTGYQAGTLYGKPHQFGTTSAAKIGAGFGALCMANPQPFAGGEYVAFDKSSDDVSVLDVLYDEPYVNTNIALGKYYKSPANQYWYIATNCRKPVTSYAVWYSRSLTTNPNSSWLDVEACNNDAVKCPGQVLPSPATTSYYCGADGRASASATAGMAPHLSPNKVSSSPTNYRNLKGFVDKSKFGTVDYKPDVDTSQPYGFYNSSFSLPSPYNNFGNTSFLKATDAGFLAGNYAPNNISRLLYVPRGWGYQADISGTGVLNEPINSSNASGHMDKLIELMGYETSNTASKEIKNAAVYTPTAGALTSAKTYFQSSLSGNVSPITQTCQQNSVVLITDGLPTGTPTGDLYSEADRTNTCVWNSVSKSCTSGSFGVAATAAITAVTDLRSVTKSSAPAAGNYDVKTYIIAVADGFGKNPNNMMVMNAMAHAGGGLPEALLATDATTFKNAMSNIAQNIQARGGVGTSGAVSNPTISAEDFAYISGYHVSNWSGEISAYKVSEQTGDLAATPSWKVSTELDDPGFSVANRIVVTSKDIPGPNTSAGRLFEWTGANALSSAQQSLLNSPGKSDGDKVLDFLRGDKTNEKTLYRDRTSLTAGVHPASRLGDIINAEMAVVGAPSADYSENGYADFKTAHANRRMIFQPANDGMVHAFDGKTGHEEWAFIPNMIIKDLNGLSRLGGAFTHKYYVDASPTTADVYISGAWKTLLVGGLGKGGRGYYALDVTTKPTSKDDARSKVKWEFPYSVNAAQRDVVTKNMGYSYGKPLIVKTGDSSYPWVVLVASGYKNAATDTGGDGKGHLFVIDPVNGDLIKDIATDACSAACGLAHIEAYIEANVVKYVYGGDLYGNVWRFDLSGSKSAWSVSKFAQLIGSDLSPQPVTSQPKVTALVLEGSTDKPYVYIGTGRYLAAPDIDLKQPQTMYALIDKGIDGKVLGRSDLLQQTLQASTTGKRKVSSNILDFDTKHGWYIDLPDSGERVNTAPVLNAEFGVLAFMSNVPSNAPCSPGGYSWLNVVEYRTGALANAMMEDSSYKYDQIGVGLMAFVITKSNTGGSPRKLILRPNLTDPGVTLDKLEVSVLPPKRISWREIVK